MKKNIDGDKISIFLVVFIIIIALGFVIYEYNQKVEISDKIRFCY